MEIYEAELKRLGKIVNQSGKTLEMPGKLLEQPLKKCKL